MTNAVVVAQTANATFGFKNRIINGGFNINQRGVSGTVILAAGVYGHDRWKAGASGCTYTFATVDNVTTLTISAGSLVQVIEGLNLQTGAYTLSWTGTAQGKIGAGSYSASGITGAAVGGTNLNIEINTGTVSLVQLERGLINTAFDFRSIGQELALCQRYYQKARACATDNGAAAATKEYAYPVNFNTAMRAAPTVTYAAITSVNVSSREATDIFEQGFRHRVIASGGPTMIESSTAIAAIEL